MKIFTTLDSINNDRECAISLGLFDGLHKAHQAVIASAVESGLVPAVFTFTMNSSLPASKKGFAPLMTVQERVDGIRDLGAELLLMPDFSEFSTLSAEAFVEDVLFARMKAKMLCCGFDFRFGKGNSGDVSLLKALCDKHNAELRVVDCVRENGKAVSSSAVRTALGEGDMKTYYDMCGRFFSVKSAVIHGRRLGSRMNFPTINQPLDPELLAPRFGVYASLAHIDGKAYPSVTNVGTKPTVSTDSSVLAETNIFEFDGDLYEKSVRVELVEFLRSEQKFPSTEELRIAIAADRKAAENYFKYHFKDRQS